MKETAAGMISDMKNKTHKMILFNCDLVVTWHFENDQVKITEVHILHNGGNNLVKFISGKVFKLIVENIEKYGVEI